MKRRLLVELDTLLDTRLGTLLKMDPTIIDKVLSDGYRDRVEDNWTSYGINMEDYQRLYEQRDEETLKRSRPTHAIAMLARVVEAIMEESVKSPEISGVSIDLNFHPYRLSKEIVAEIVETVRFQLNDTVDITAVILSNETLTPEYIDLHYDAIVLYDFNAWIVEHAEALKERQIPTVVFMTPAIYRNQVDTEGAYIEELKTKVSAFAALEMVMTQYLHLQMNDTRYFSLIEL